MRQGLEIHYMSDKGYYVNYILFAATPIGSVRKDIFQDAPLPFVRPKNLERLLLNTRINHPRAGTGVVYFTQPDSR